MKSKNIYIIRHGQTDYNLQNMVQGRGIDSSLNEVGRKQAAKFYKKYKNTKFNKIYTSALKRTVESVQGFLDDGIPYEGLPGLDEISWGMHEGQPYDELRHGLYLAGIDEWKKGNTHFKVGGGESPEEVAIRQKKTMDYILKKEDEQLILIATHGRAMRILLCWMLGKPLQESDDFEHSNLCLYQVTFDGKKFKIIKANDTSHLE